MLNRHRMSYCNDSGRWLIVLSSFTVATDPRLTFLLWFPNLLASHLFPYLDHPILSLKGPSGEDLQKKKSLLF